MKKGLPFGKKPPFGGKETAKEERAEMKAMSAKPKAPVKKMAGGGKVKKGC